MQTNVKSSESVMSTDLVENRCNVHPNGIGCSRDMDNTVQAYDEPNSLPADSGFIESLPQWSPHSTPIQSTPIQNDCVAHKAEHFESAMIDSFSQTLPLSSSTGVQTVDAVQKVIAMAHSFQQPRKSMPKLINAQLKILISKQKTYYLRTLSHNVTSKLKCRVLIQ